MKKPNCYECKHRGTIPGDAHSCCEYPGINTGFFDPTNKKIAKKLKIKGNPHGIKKGWFMWPIKFYPVWLENCEGFEQKGE